MCACVFGGGGYFQFCYTLVNVYDVFLSILCFVRLYSLFICPECSLFCSIVKYCYPYLFRVQ